MSFVGTIKKGILDDNPTFTQVIGMCPVLGVTTSVENGIGMGIATTAVLIGSNLVISLLRKIIPDEVRIPCFIVVIASFVTIVQLLMQAYLKELNDSLGIFIPLIVVNCIILARAEAFAFKNGPLLSIADGIGMGIGFTCALVMISSVRELLGAKSILGVTILPEFFPETMIMISPPGAFFTLAMWMILINYLRNKKKTAKTA